MTYRLHLEQLLDDVTRKSEAYLQLSSELNHRSTRHTRGNSDRLKKTREEWGAAEHAYAAFMILIKSKQINPNDIIADDSTLVGAHA